MSELLDFLIGQGEQFRRSYRQSAGDEDRRAYILTAPVEHVCHPFIQTLPFNASLIPMVLQQIRRPG